MSNMWYVAFCQRPTSPGFRLRVVSEDASRLELGSCAPSAGDMTRARDLHCILTMRYDRGGDTWNDIFGGGTSCLE